MRDFKRRPTREQMEGQIRQNENDMKIKEEKLDCTATDVETVRETYDELELDGTVEGTDQIEQNLEKSEEVTIEVFDTDGKELDDIQGMSTEYKDEVKERSEFSENDLQKASLARSKIETLITIQHFELVKEAIVADIGFLQERLASAIQDIDQSEDNQEHLINRVHHAHRARSSNNDV